MSDDLISRCAVMEYLRDQQENVITENNKKGFVSPDVCDGMNSAISAFMNFIEQMPMSYDVDKIVTKIMKDLNDRIDNQLKILAGIGDKANRYGFVKALEAYQQCKLIVEQNFEEYAPAWGGKEREVRISGNRKRSIDTMCRYKKGNRRGEAADQQT